MSAQDIFEHNPYEDHPSLTPLEADVLWEYAKLNQHIKDVRTQASRLCSATRQCWARSFKLIVQTRRLSEKPDESLLKQLRVLERKMGLVFTLVRRTRWPLLSGSNLRRSRSSKHPHGASLATETTHSKTPRQPRIAFWTVRH